MKQSTIVWIVVAIIIVLAGWYYIAMAPAQPYVAPTSNAGLNGSPNQTNTGAQNVTPVVTVSSNATLGTFLVAPNGMTLYVFAKDTPNVSNCTTGVCAANWPAYSPNGSEPLVAGDGARGQLSTITWPSGTTQLTYNSAPLYFFKNDLKPGDTKGENVMNVWTVVKP